MLFFLINLFLLEQSLVGITIEQLMAGDEFKISKKQEAQLNNLRKIALNFENCLDVEEYLELVSKNIRIKKQ